MESLNFSCLLKPHDLRNIISSHNGLLTNLVRFEDDVAEFKRHKEELQEQLNKQLSKEVPNYEEITNMKVQDALK